jgi:hypothetical protein
LSLQLAGHYTKRQKNEAAERRRRSVLLPEARMKLNLYTLCLSGWLLATLPLAASSVRGTSSIHTSSKRHKTIVHAAPAMDPQRATQIQTALIKAGYLNGEPTGTWDASSNAAMQKFQSDHGWQTKLTPDSRALNLLGLGPQTPQSPQTPQTN